jgi:hypothetical protein
MAQGLTALDPRTAAASKFVEEKIQKGELQPDQVADFLLRMGADPRLAGLVFKYQRVEQAAKNQGQGQPPTTTVNQDVSNQYAQLKQQERMKQGLGGMSAPAIANAAMQGGITGEPVQAAAGGGLMRLAGGGPIAFANGGRPPRTYTVGPDGEVDIGSAGDLIPYEAPVEPEKARSPSFLRKIMRNPLLRRAGYAGLGLTGLSFLLDDDEEPKKPQGAKVEQVPEGLSDEDYANIKQLEAQRKATSSAAGAGLPAPPKFIESDISELKNRVDRAKSQLPKDEQAAIDAELAREKPYLDTLAARRTKLEEQEKKETTSPEKKFWLAFAQAGFAASAKGARNLWETLSMGGVEGLKAYESMKDKERQLLERIQDKKFAIDDLSAQVKRTASKTGVERLDRLTKEYNDSVADLTRVQVGIDTAKNTRAGQIWETQAREAGADRRAALTREQRNELLKLDNAIDSAIIQSANPQLTEQQRKSYARLAEYLTKQREAKESTESGVLAARERIAAQQAFIKKKPSDDGFGDAEQVE